MNLNGKISNRARMSGMLITQKTNVSGNLSIPKSETEKDYNELFNKPMIEGIELIGNKELEEFGIIEASAQDILDIFEED